MRTTIWPMICRGQKALARQYAEKALAMIDSHATPFSSWSDTDQRRAEVRNAVKDVLRKLATTAATTWGARPKRIDRGNSRMTDYPSVIR